MFHGGLTGDPFLLAIASIPKSRENPIQEEREEDSLWRGICFLNCNPSQREREREREREVSEREGSSK